MATTRTVGCNGYRAPVRRVLFLLGDLSDADIEWLAVACEARNFATGEVLIEQGRQIAEIYILLKGELSVHVSATGDVELARLEPGEIVGELSFLDSRPPNATVKARVSSRVIAIARDKLSARLARDTAFAARFYRALGVFLASRLRQTVGRMGFGAADGSLTHESDEIDPVLLDNTALAAARFEMLLARFRES